jgi:hypothetical protein
MDDLRIDDGHPHRETYDIPETAGQEHRCDVFMYEYVLLYLVHAIGSICPPGPRSWQKESSKVQRLRCPVDADFSLHPTACAEYSTTRTWPFHGSYVSVAGRPSVGLFGVRSVGRSASAQITYTPEPTLQSQRDLVT